MNLNFCRIYNKTLNKMYERKNVKSVSLLTGIPTLILLVFGYILWIAIKNVYHLLEYVITPFYNGLAYFVRKTGMKAKNYSPSAMFIATMLIALISIFIKIALDINHWFAYILFSFFAYMFAIVAISIIIDMLYEKGTGKGDILFDNFVICPIVNPCKYILDKTLSHCDLKNDNH